MDARTHSIIHIYIYFHITYFTYICVYARVRLSLDVLAFVSLRVFFLEVFKSYSNAPPPLRHTYTPLVNVRHRYRFLRIVILLKARLSPLGSQTLWSIYNSEWRPSHSFPPPSKWRMRTRANCFVTYTDNTHSCFIKTLKNLRLLEILKLFPLEKWNKIGLFSVPIVNFRSDLFG